MTKNEIKKTLYREKPEAKLIDKGRTGGIVDIDFHRYEAETSLGTVRFFVPDHEMGERPFGETEPAQLLFRWMEGTIS